MNRFWARTGQGITRFFLWAYNNYPGKFIGIILGFISGLFVVTLGFWRTLVLALFVAIGFMIGKRLDDHQSLPKWLERFFE
ncbi:MAG: DUF2273 domain-containing protein [Desulfitobacteriaceae bacterium]